MSRVGRYTEGAPWSGTPRILVVEDDELLRKSLSTFVRSLGYNVASVRSAEEAFAQGDLYRMDLCVVDYQLPGMNGLEFISTLQRRGLRMPALLMSGYLNSPIRLDAIRQSILEVLLKPMDMKHLAQTLQRALRVGAPS